MPKIKIEGKRNKLTDAQETFFILGYTWPHLGDKEYPFQNGTGRDLLWKKHRAFLMDRMLSPREIKFFPIPLRMPNGNQLRPKEWFSKVHRNRKGS